MPRPNRHDIPSRHKGARPGYLPHPTSFNEGLRRRELVYLAGEHARAAGRDVKARNGLVITTGFLVQ